MSTRLFLLVSIQAMILFVYPFRACTVTVDDVVSLVREQTLKVETLQGWLSHEIRAEGETEELTGKFYYKVPQKLKIHYVSPEEMFVLCVQETLWTYVPSTDEVNMVRSPGSDLAPGRGEGYMQFILDPITPLLPDYNFSFLWRGSIEDYEEVWVIQGGPSSSESPISRILFWVDAQMGKVLRAEIYNAKEALVLIVLLSEFSEITPRVWLPGHYSVTAATSEGEVAIETQLSRLKLNQPIQDSVFQVKVPGQAKTVSPERR